MPGIIKINAPQVLSVPANDNGEKLIDLLKDFPNLKVDITRRYSQKLSNSISHLRKGVAEKLQRCSLQSGQHACCCGREGRGDGVRKPFEKIFIGGAGRAGIEVR